jgi:hypothetical protein
MIGEMIERVARAMCVIAIGGEYDGPTPRMWRECARAAIEAMREPTKEMLHQGQWPISPGNEEETIDIADNVWRYMIDEALK